MLNEPGPGLAQAELEIEAMSPTRLVRVSAFRENEPYFGRTGANRFDDPKGGYGTCYFGQTLKCAFAETVLHDEVGNNGFELAVDALDRLVHAFEGDELRLANMTGSALKSLGGTGALSTVTPYAVPQAWSAALYAHRDNVDGILYQSNHCNTEQAVVLFDRAAEKIRSKACVYLLKHPEQEAVLKAFRVRITQ